MTRVAIYARYSSDLQTDASIEDQFRLAEKRADQEGWKVIERYADHGVSGSSMVRSGIVKLMEDAVSGKFDIVLAEALDRLSRDQENIAGLYKRMKFWGIKIITLSEGEINEMHIGLKGTMNALFLKDLADKTRRGMNGRVTKGKSGGGLTYGYDVVKAYDSKGEPIRGERSINEKEAEIVRRIFTDYSRGKSPLLIAKELNQEGVVSPTGTGWGPTTFYGNRDRGTGILNNEIYMGTLVWNRLRYIKDPETGRRVSRLNPESQWVRTLVPELRIVDQELWDKVKVMQGDIKKQHKEFWGKRRPNNLFSNLIKCGCCGGGFSKLSIKDLGCSAAKNKGTCSNTLTMPQEKLEKAVLKALEDHLMTPELCQAFCDEYTRHVNKLRMEHNAKISGYRAELAKIMKTRERILRAVREGWNTIEMKDELDQCVIRRAELEKILENPKEEPVLIHPSMGDRYRKEIQSLIEMLHKGEHRQEAIILIRQLVQKIVATPKEDDENELAIDLYGDLAGILNIATKAKPSISPNDIIVKNIREITGLFAENDEAQPIDFERKSLNYDAKNTVKMVAGARFELTTFRL